MLGSILVRLSARLFAGARNDSLTNQDLSSVFLVIEIWSLFGIWYLCFGAFLLSSKLQVLSSDFPVPIL